MSRIFGSSLEEFKPLYVNQPYTRPDGRVCLAKNLVHLDTHRPWTYETWCGEEVTQAGWDPHEKTLTCITCIAQKQG